MNLSQSYYRLRNKVNPGFEKEQEQRLQKAALKFERYQSNAIWRWLDQTRIRFILYTWSMNSVLVEKEKRALDILFALILLPLMSPFMILAAIAIKLDSPGPVIFKQKRVGKWGKEFDCYKFRSMVTNAEKLKSELRELNEADEIVFKIKSDPRITRVGRIIRKLSIDELPQLFNVLKGDMSLVGPRPPVPHEVQQYQYEYFLRLNATPGITGLQQISGRSDLSFKRWVELDVNYIANQSPTKDLEIMIKTVPTVLSRKGAY